VLMKKALCIWGGQGNPDMADQLIVLEAMALE